MGALKETQRPHPSPQTQKKVSSETDQKRNSSEWLAPTQHSYGSQKPPLALTDFRRAAYEFWSARTHTIADLSCKGTCNSRVSFLPLAWTFEASDIGTGRALLGSSARSGLFGTSKLYPYSSKSHLYIWRTMSRSSSV